MKRPVVIRPRAEADVMRAWQWYEDQRNGLGDEFLLEVRRVVDSLQTDYEQRPIYYRDFRRLLIRQFPYKLFYRVEVERIVVFRILHVSRDHRQLL